MAPLRTIRELHRRTAAELGMGSREDIESLLSEVQQLLVGISIMQVSNLPLNRLLDGVMPHRCKDAAHNRIITHAGLVCIMQGRADYPFSTGPTAA